MGRWDANDNDLLSMIAQYTSPKGTHQRIHEGVVFASGIFRGEGVNVADNGSISMAFTIGGTPAHFVTEVSCGGDAEIEILEGSSITVASTLVAYNRKRTSSRTASTIVTQASTVSGGTPIFRKTIPGGTGPFSSGGNGKPFEQEWVLSSSTTYVVRATNRSGASQPMSINSMWYESGE